MKLLLDTHLLIWAAAVPTRLPPAALALMTDEANEICFSAVNTWELGIKFMLAAGTGLPDPRPLRDGLLLHGFPEIAVTGAHALEVMALPPIHRDPFDRMLIAQARVEGMTLLTNDARLAAYGFPVRAL